MSWIVKVLLGLAVSLPGSWDFDLWEVRPTPSPVGEAQSTQAVPTSS